MKTIDELLVIREFLTGKLKENKAELLRQMYSGPGSGSDRNHCPDTASKFEVGDYVKRNGTLTTYRIVKARGNRYDVEHIRHADGRMVEPVIFYRNHVLAAHVKIPLSASPLVDSAYPVTFEGSEL